MAKQKIKTNKSFKKRFKITKTWKLIYRKCWWNHLLTNKNKANRAERFWKTLSKTQVKRVANLIHY